jgi:stage II sporulation protein Q
VKNWINKIPKEKWQRYIFLGMLILVFVAFFISLVLIDRKAKPDPNQGGNNDPIDGETPGNNDEPVVELFRMPIQGTDHEIVKKYWYKAEDATEEETALLYYVYEGSSGTTYSQSLGISIIKQNNEAFNVICSMGGTVKKVENDSLHGTVVTIEHSDNVLTEYISLSSTTLEEGDVVKQGDVIGVSGESAYDNLPSHVQFRINKDNQYYDPEKLIGKSIKDVK